MGYPMFPIAAAGYRSLNQDRGKARCRRLASALAQRGIGVGDTVAVMLPNTPAMIDAHFGVAMTGAVLNTLNTRIDAAVSFLTRTGKEKHSIPVRVTDA